MEKVQEESKGEDNLNFKLDALDLAYDEKLVFKPDPIA